MRMRAHTHTHTNTHEQGEQQSESSLQMREQTLPRWDCCHFQTQHTHAHTHTQKRRDGIVRCSLKLTNPRYIRVRDGFLSYQALIFSTVLGWYFMTELDIYT